MRKKKVNVILSDQIFEQLELKTFGTDVSEFITKIVKEKIV